MKYFFVVNGRPDKKDLIDKDLEKQLADVDIQYEIYHTAGVGDGTRYVRVWCDLHEKEEACFVACGGSGTLNEVASGLVGFSKKTLAYLAYGSTNDFIKHFPGRNWKSLNDILNGSSSMIDIIKVNDNYSINVVNVGFDAMAALYGYNYMQKGIDGKTAYKRGAFRSLIGDRVNHIKVTADGVPLNKRTLMMCTIGNASWCGGQFHCLPDASVDDGLMDICLIKPLLLLEFAALLPHYESGTLKKDEFSKGKAKFVRAKHVELRSRDLIYLSLDGEILASRSVDLDIVPKAVQMIMPARGEVKK